MPWLRAPRERQKKTCGNPYWPPGRREGSALSPPKFQRMFSFKQTNNKKKIISWRKPSRESE
jgi:hypothetical protein